MAEQQHHLPPTDIPASELWLKLKSAPRPSELVEFPWMKGEKVRIQVLRLDEHESCRLTALTRLKDRKFSPEEVPQEIYGDAVAVEVLWRAVVRPDPLERPDGTLDYYPIAPNSDELRRTLTADQLVTLFNLYLQVQHRLGPTEKSVSSIADLNAWVDRLVAAESEFPLASFTWPQLAELTSLLAREVSQLRASQVSQETSSQPTSESDPTS